MPSRKNADPGQSGSTRRKFVSPLLARRRRRLRFESLDEVFEEAQRLCQISGSGTSRPADNAGDAGLVHLANMHLGQLIGHLALSIEFSVNGTPFTMPAIVRLAALFIRSYTLRRRVEIPLLLPDRVESQLIPPAGITPAESVQMLQAAVALFRKSTTLLPNPIFGEMTKQDWELFHIRHAEWHLGFVRER